MTGVARRSAGVGAAIVALAAIAAAPPGGSGAASIDDGRRIRLAMPGVDRIELLREPEDGTYVYRVRFAGGRSELLSPDDLAAALYRADEGRPFWQRLLNISSVFGIAWVALGLLGQILFTGRMLVQWIASEKARRSIIPVSFWWMSLGGATMLIVYFVWRRDIVGVLGQSTGWVIYARNLVLIHGRDGHRG